LPDLSRCNIPKRVKYIPNYHWTNISNQR
jgi:hypothetical protein